MLAPSGYFGAFFGALFAASAGNGVSAVSADSTTTYPVRSAAASSVSAAYPVRGSVQRDAAASYSVLSLSAVVTSNAVAYQVLCAAYRDGDAAYQVRSSVAASGGALFSVRQAVQSDLVVSYYQDAATSVVTSDCATHYAVKSISGVSVSVEEITTALLAALNATTIPVDVKKINAVTITGTGVSGDPMRPA